MTGTNLIDIESTPWTRRALQVNASRTADSGPTLNSIHHVASTIYATSFSSTTTDKPPPRPKPARKYKPVDRKHRPVPTYAPPVSPTKYRPVKIVKPEPLPENVGYWKSATFGKRVTRERLEEMMSKVEVGTLTSKETDLLAAIVIRREKAFAWTQDERGAFSRDYYEDYIIQTIEHEPWQKPPIRVPEAIRQAVCEEIYKGDCCGRFEGTESSYRSALFAVKKKTGVRLVVNLEPLNQVTIQDSTLPPNINDFAQSFVGYAIYGLFDMLSGFDARWVDKRSRALQAFHTPAGARQQATLVQGFTNAVQEFQRSMDHAVHQIRHMVTAFLDDCGLRGPRSRYDDEEIRPGIRRFVYEYLENLDLFLAVLIEVGITASGTKAILAAFRLRIVGSIVSLEGWDMDGTMVDKILSWPLPTDLTLLRGFLGVAGVGRRWIKGFALIAKPLTVLTRGTDNIPFFMSTDAIKAFEELKHRISTRPVIIVIDYEQVILIQRVRASDEGLVMVGVDGCMEGAGWALYQVRDSQKHPAGFGSATFSTREQNYGQPKSELYAVYRAFKDIRHRIWGILFRLLHDAQSLSKMITDPDDVPNAPILRWIMYIRLFSFEYQHVPAVNHKVEDALSRRPHVVGEKVESLEEQETFLDAVVNQAERLLRTDAKSFFDLLAIRYTPSYDDSWRLTGSLVRIHKSSSLGIPSLGSPKVFSYSDGERSFISHVSLRFVRANTVRFLPEFYTRSIYRTEDCEYELGDDVVSGEVRVCHTYSAFSTSNAGEKHAFKVRDKDGPDHWAEICSFLTTNKAPDEYSPSQVKSLYRKARRFFLRDGRLWLSPKSKSDDLPRLVVEDVDRRGRLMAVAHNKAGHHGRDATYLHLFHRFYWPNMYEDVSYFVRSCIECQKLLKPVPIVPLNVSWQTPILRHFNLDTVHMPRGIGGFKYIIQALEPNILWPEAKALRFLTAAAVAKFIFNDLICRFACIPILSMDAGPEFQKEVKDLLATQYHCTVIISTPYHPQGNGTVERAHVPLVEAITKAAGDSIGNWPLLLPAALFAIRITTSRATGFSPYFLLYGVHPVLTFDLTEETWQTLDWDKVTSTVDLLTIRILQLQRKDLRFREAILKLRRSRQQGIDDHLKKHRHFGFHDFEPGMYVWLRESQLETQQGNKTDWTYSGPYVVHEKRPTGSYVLRELDGTVMKSHVNPERLRLFYFRPDNQTLRSKIPTRPKVRQPGTSFLQSDFLYNARDIVLYEDVLEFDGRQLGRDPNVRKSSCRMVQFL